MQQNQPNQLPSHPNISYQSSQPITDMNSPQYSHLRKNPSLQLYGSRVQLGESHLQQSMASLQSMESSEPVFTQYLTNQTFSILYNGNIFMVDPASLSKSSMKFRELIEPFIENCEPLTNATLNVSTNTFTNRNMENFLKLCQNLPTDVKDDEMKEICEIAKMFEAKKIYDKGLNFVQNSIDSEFYVPDYKYDESNGKKYLFITVKKPSERTLDSEDVKSVIYQIKIESRGIKKPIYRFVKDDETLLFSAKKNYYDIFIVDGSDVHIEKNKQNHIGQIHQHTDGYNIIRARDLKFKLWYVNSGKPDDLSIEVSFPFDDQRRVEWSPKKPVHDPVKDKYFLNFAGNYHRVPIKSSRNIVLQNADGHSTFICRKMDQKTFEVECLPEINPLIAFEIGLSDIVGPYTN